jgi:hypothetical protein
MNPNKKIKIEAATGPRDKNDLIGCYFQQDEAPATTYTFYNQQETALATGITSDTQFSFSFPNSHITWNITPTIVPDTSASGTWSNTDPTIDADESGNTWTAEAVPMPEGEEHSAEDDDSAASAIA